MVAVLMSTYNGVKYLKEQIDSVLAQSYRDFLFYIRDDGSVDGTQDLVQSYEDPRIIFIQGKNMGPAGSFFALLQNALDCEYVFFCDQDDLWHEDKIERMLEAIRPYDDMPTMVFSDFAMIDSDGVVTSDSYAEYASLQISPGNTQLSKVLAQPYVFGCASVINRRLSELVAFPPEGIEMHDCWICQSAAAIGNLIYMPEQTISHRFHSSNATGRTGQDSFAARIRRATGGFQKQTENTALRLHQVELLLAYHNTRLLPEVRVMLTGLSNAMKKGRIATVCELRKYGVARQKKINTIFFYLSVLGMKGELK